MRPSALRRCRRRQTEHGLLYPLPHPPPPPNPSLPPVRQATNSNRLRLSNVPHCDSRQSTVVVFFVSDVIDDDGTTGAVIFGPLPPTPTSFPSGKLGCLLLYCAPMLVEVSTSHVDTGTALSAAMGAQFFVVVACCGDGTQILS